MSTRHAFLAPILILLAAAVAGGTSLARMSIEELTAAAGLVARARCLGNTARWEGGEIWTITTFEVLEVWKGVLPGRRSQIEVQLIGGRSGHLVSTVSGVPRFEAGEEVILFLEPTRAGRLSVTSWAQGSFRIRRDLHSGGESVTQDTAGVAVFDPVARQFRNEGIRGLPLERLRERVLAAVEKESGGKP